MRVFPHYRETPADAGPCALAIGSFDGLHLGHQLLLSRCRQRAELQGIAAAVLTFEPHPARALAPGLSPPLLMSAVRKICALSRVGLDWVLQQRFDAEFAALSPEHFAEQVLVGRLGVRDVVVGDDFTFGRDRSGTVEDLLACGERLGFAVEVVRRLAVEGMTASSTRIRAFLLQGRVRAAALLLGRLYLLEGRVVPGAGRGRSLGVPTANLHTEAELVPGGGVYVSRAFSPGWEGGRLALTNIGQNPTFGTGPTSVETHVLDQSGEWDGQPLALAFLDRLRGEQAFPDPQALVAQIRQDIAEARRRFPLDPGGAELDPLDGLEWN